MTVVQLLSYNENNKYSLSKKNNFMAVVETLAKLFVLIVIVKSLLLLLRPEKLIKWVKGQYIKNSLIQAIIFVLGIIIIFFGIQGTPLENVLTLLLGFSFLVSAVLRRYPKSLAIMADEVIGDRWLKILSIIGLFVGVYLLYLLV